MLEWLRLAERFDFFQQREHELAIGIVDVYFFCSILGAISI